MKTQIQSLHFNMDKRLLNLVEDKIAKFPLVYDRIENCKVTLFFDKDDRNRNYVAEILINVPGKRIFAEQKAETFEMAVTQVSDEIIRQLHHHKEKLNEFV